MQDVLVIPGRAGPLRPLARQPDGVDEALDELLGAEDPAGPGVADAALLVGGAALGLTVVFIGLPGWVGALGLVMLGLGLVLPVRAAVRRLRSGRVAAGRLLDVGDQTVSRLARAHARVLALAGLSPDARQRQAVGLAHLAVVEVGGLLQGARPAAEHDRRYVEERAAGLECLAEDLAGSPAPDRELRAQALRELEESTGTGALAGLAAWRREYLL